MSTGSNTVEVDADALLAQANAAVAGAFDQVQPAAPGATNAPGEQMTLLQDSWRPLIEGLVPTLRMTAFAQWQIPPNLEGEFITSLAQTLDVLFPGGMSGKWASLARLIACSAGIVFVNFSANGGKLPPLGLKKRDDKPAIDGQLAKAA